MSQHDIEGVVEDSVRLVAASARPDDDKRHLIRALYDFQALFDTSDTEGRVAAELAALDYAAFTPSRAVSLLDLVAEVIAEADAGGDRQLIHHWLGTLTEEIDNFTIGTAELPMVENFAAFRAEEAARRIRAIATKHDVHRFRSRLSYIRLRSWPDVRYGLSALDARTIERKHVLRFLLDLKAEEDAIAKAYEKETAKLARIPDSAVYALPELVAERGPFSFLGREEKGDERIFIFAAGETPDDSEASRIYLEILHNADLNLLVASICVQSGALHRWRGTAFGSTRSDMHFQQNLFQLVPGPELENDKAASAWGGWTFRLDQSRKVLGFRLDSLLGHWPHTMKTQSFHAVPQAQRLAAKDVPALEKERKKFRDKHGYFTNDIDLLFACACLSWDRGERPTALIADIKDKLRFVHNDYPLKREWTDGAKRLGDGAFYPKGRERFPYRRHDEPQPALD